MAAGRMSDEAQQGEDGGRETKKSRGERFLVWHRACKERSGEGGIEEGFAARYVTRSAGSERSEGGAKKGSRGAETGKRWS